MSFYFDRRCKISAMLFFFFFFFFFFFKPEKIPIPPPPPPQKKKKFLCYEIGSFLQAKPYLLTAKNDSGIYLNVCMMYSLFLWGDESSHFPVLK